MKYLVLEEVDSTNSYISAHAAELEDMTMVMAGTQTAGRGQRGNSWESEPGLNLTFSLFFRPKGVKPAEQFAISEATALAVTDMLASAGIEAKVKWPNDIYVDDRKICGILIEHSLLGNSLEHSCLGIGINVNQTEFRSDAPNPVSMKMLTGTDHDLSQCAARVYSALETRLARTATPEGREALHKEFMARLWRGDGDFHPFRERNGGEEFEGRIVDVEPCGLMHLRAHGEETDRVYAFKEVEFLLK